MARLRYNNQAGTLGAALTNSGTTITFKSAPNFATITAPDYIPIEIDGGTSTYELVYLTAYTSGQTTGTITRAAEDGTNWPAVAHSATAGWAVAPTVLDFQPATVVVPAATGNTTADAANIAAAISAVSAVGGTVQLQAGTYAVSSAAKNWSTVGSSSTSWTYTGGSISTADIGSYVIGVNINGRAPKITAVNPGVGFTTDIAPGGTVSGTVTVVSPGVTLPDGVTIQGQGAAHGSIGTTAGATVIVDSGTGASIFLRGGNNTGAYYGRSRIRDISVWGSATTGSAGTIGNTLAGLWINNNTSFMEISGCDLSGHKTWGMALDYNMNAVDCRNTTFTYNGNPAASTDTGGVGMQPFNVYVSAGVAFYNCWWQANYGWGITGVASGNKTPIMLNTCQFATTLTTSAYHSGTAIACGGYSTVLINCWIESSATYDIDVEYAQCTVIGGVLSGAAGSPAYAINVNNVAATLTLINVTSVSHGTATISNNGGNISYQNCNIGGSASNDPIFISGGPTAVEAVGMGTITGPLGIVATTGLGNGASGNLTALAKGTGSGPASDAVNKWVPVSINGTDGWIPFFV